MGGSGTRADNSNPGQHAPLFCQATIVNRRGLHARAAAKFVKTAERYAAEIKVAKDGVCVSGTSIMGLMMLAASRGTTLDIRARGTDAKAALDALTSLIASGFEEKE